MNGIRERLPEYVLELLPFAQMQELALAVAQDPALQHEADQLRVALTRLVDDLPPLAPSPQVRARLMTTTASSVERFAPFVAALARITHLSIDKMRAVLARIEDATFWDQGLPGIELAHFDGGADLAGADAGFIRFAPSAIFPRHRHIVGREITFVMEGTMLDGGRAHGPGSVVEHEQDSVHFCGATADQPLLILVLHHGIVPVFES
jgi:hypothetical protein